MSKPPQDQTGRTILYYPLINIPTSGPWIRSALLYWDNLASIVPRSYDDMRDEQAMERYSADLRWLYQERVFRPVNPDLLLHDGVELQKFEREVVASVSKLRRTVVGTRPSCTEPVFKQKISEMLFHELEELGMAEERNETRDDHYTYYFHPSAAAAYMALLANYLAPRDSSLTVPATDQKAAFDIAFTSGAVEKKHLSIGANLFEILPRPLGNVPLRKVLKFRADYRAELLSFRSEMDRFEDALRKSENDKEMKAVVIRSKERIEKECLNLRKALKGSRIQTILGSVQAFLKAPSPYLIAAGAVLLNRASELSKVPIQYTIGGAVAVGGVQVTIQYLKQRHQRSAKMRESPFAYLFLAKTKSLRE